MQGFNMGRYVPPDQEGVVSGNTLNRKHPLGARASKLASHGILTVRFEMPFAVWCAHCPKPTIIGQGVRFNAEKQRVGSYHSTPIYSFRIKHTACGGELEIRTDPQRTRYVVVSGGKERDHGSDEDSLVKFGADAAVAAILTQKERADLRESAFGKLEKTIADRERLDDARQRIDELQDAAARHWDDPYAQNQRLRKAFRAGRHEREKDAVLTQDLADRMCLGIELLPGTEEDARRAALVDFGDIDDADDDDAVKKKIDAKALAKPLFDHHPSKTSKPKHEGIRSQQGRRNGREKPLLLKSEIAVSKMRESLVSEIVGNTRAAKDPFLLDFDFTAKSRDKGGGVNAVSGASSSSSRLPGLLKRKRMTVAAASGAEDRTTTASPVLELATTSPLENDTKQGRPPPVSQKSGEIAATSAGTMTGLVSYDSDSD
ncbi:hypothetical protein B0H66DRAFT_286526 [Apodospora peruviana]|uniref:Coiled-coil domain-containing protein 130 n=1 Tax=Apodospora peruviana TaxID=516989 RepID=A0AAE0M1W6_9PEZI|nr:hypothetical protein B0H66DRAFT_286526 [Apodospora peruviana]